MAEILVVDPHDPKMIEGIAKARWERRFGEGSWEGDPDSGTFARDHFRESARLDLTAGFEAADTQRIEKVSVLTGSWVEVDDG